MNIWFVLWIFFSVFILGTFLWSFQILLRQKRVWSEFAKKNQMVVEQNAFYRSPVLRGEYKGRMVSIFSEEQPSSDNRGRRFRSVVQFELPSGMPCEGAVASSEYRNFISTLGLKDSVTPEVADWPKSLAFRSNDPAQLKDFLTADRLKVLATAFSGKNVTGLFLFNGAETLLRFETADPLDDLGRLDRFVSKCVEGAKILALK